MCRKNVNKERIETFQIRETSRCPMMSHLLRTGGIWMWCLLRPAQFSVLFFSLLYLKHKQSSHENANLILFGVQSIASLADIFLFRKIGVGILVGSESGAIVAPVSSVVGTLDDSKFFSLSAVPSFSSNDARSFTTFFTFVGLACCGSSFSSFTGFSRLTEELFCNTGFVSARSSRCSRMSLILNQLFPEN